MPGGNRDAVGEVPGEGVVETPPCSSAQGASMSATIVLTPAQQDFLAEAVEGFEARLWHCTCAGAAGSDRRFVRVASPGGDSYILVVWNSEDRDWDRFLRIERDLRRVCSFLPRVFAHDDRHGLILEEDLGSRTLHAAVGEGVVAQEREGHYRSVLDALVHWQGISPGSSAVIDSREMDKEQFLWESDYFARHCVTLFCGREALLDSAWESEREQMASRVVQMPQVVIHRDFQSENILLTSAGVRFVDFQGARRGPAGYDLASLLYDPYVAALDEDLTARLCAGYGALAAGPFEPHDLWLCAAQRLMQALGAYANLSLHRGKERYRLFIPVALARLTRVLRRLPAFPRLHAVAAACRESVNAG